MNTYGNGEGRRTGPPVTVRSHAYVIRGGSEQERTEAASELAAAILCIGDHKPCGTCRHCEKVFRGIHPDVMILDRNSDTRSIYIEQIRNIRADAAVLPNDAEKKVYIIHHADSMNPAAQNALLKLLEEPPSFVSLLLTAENPAALLATVRSRCTELPAGRALPDLSGVQDIVDAFFGAMTDDLALVSFAFRLEKLEKSRFADFLAGARALAASKLRNVSPEDASALPPERLQKAVSVLTRASGYLAANVSLGHIAGMICAELMTAAEAGTARDYFQR